MSPKLRVICWLLVVLAYPRLATADDITPTDRVVNLVNVREGPSTETPIVGGPQKAQRGPLLKLTRQRCLVVPMRSGNQMTLSSAEQGVFFDIDGDGELELVAWPEEPEIVGLLALDRDGDGAITSGKELFGNVTFGDGKSGFHALIALERDQDGDSLLAGRDKGFDSLLLWFDRNRDGVSQPNELEPAKNYLVEIGLNAFGVGKKDQHGNLFYLQGWMRLKEKPEEKRPVYDVILPVQ